MSDSNRTVCHCLHCRIRGLMGPLMIITVGVLFLIGEYTRFSFLELWPVLLIVAGVVLTAQSLASKEGHLDS
jgi:cell wall-active antibiotic response 4TMS protein YvqF